jgi:hypothetical protein
MLRHPLVLAALGIYFLWGGWHWFAYRPLHPPDGVLAAEEPRQVNVEHGEELKIGHWTLTERAQYQITARILSREGYRFDALAGLIPLDLALGWGPMSDNRVLHDIDISQSDRFYFWHANALPIPRDAIVSHSANTHVIPRTSLVAKQLKRLRPGQVVTLSGELVDGRRDDGLWIKTSMSREDTGAGACEVLLVADVRF